MISKSRFIFIFIFMKELLYMNYFIYFSFHVMRGILFLASVKDTEAQRS